MSASLAPKPDVRVGFVLLITIVALVAAAKAVLYGPVDPDLFLHLIAADHLWRDGIQPIVDQTSYMSKSQPWTPYSWLAELGMKLIWDTGGHRAGVITYAVLSVAIVGLTAWACRAAQFGTSRATGNLPARALSQRENATGQAACGTQNGVEVPAPALFGVAVATAAATFLTLPFLSFRPVTMAFVLMAAIAGLIYRDRARGETTRAVWLVIPLTVVLVNVHLFAILIAGWMGALFTGSLVERWRATDEMKVDATHRLKRSFALAAGASLACLATPMLPGAIESLLQYQFTDPIVASGMVQEFRPFYLGTMGYVALAIVLAMVAAIVANRRLLRVSDWLTLALASFLLLKMGRMSPVFAIMVAPLFAQAIGGMSDGVLARPALRAVMAILAIIIGVRVATSLPPRDVLLDDWMTRHEAGYPVAAVAFLETSVTPHSKRIINDYSWGGYLAWRLAGQYKVLMTGNTTAFPIDLWSRTYFCDDTVRRQTLVEANADAAIIPTKTSPFRNVLVELGWTVAFTDGQASVMVPPTATVAQQDARVVD